MVVEIRSVLIPYKTIAPEAVLVARRDPIVLVAISEFCELKLKMPITSPVDDEEDE